MEIPHPTTVNPREKARRILKKSAATLGITALFLLTLWTFGAIHFDGPWPGLANTTLAITWLATLWIALTRFRHPAKRLAAWLAIWAIAIIPWSLKRPSNQRDWAPEFARTAAVTVNGDAVTFTNFRNFQYADDGSILNPRWETRTFNLSNLRHMDFFMTYWGGGKLVGHPIFSFDFGPQGHIAFSIESRRETHETYSVIGGLYKLYELTCIVSDETDSVRLRSNIRPGEDVYLYRLDLKPETVHARFSEFIETIDDLSKRPRFYNVLTANCTTAVRSQMKTPVPMDWRIIANGKLDELLREKDALAVKNLPFPDLKRLSHINPKSKSLPADPTFSPLIRQGLPGF
jgi:hypothetical protein